MKRLIIFSTGTLASVALVLSLTLNDSALQAQQKSSKGGIEAQECTISMQSVAILASERVGALLTVRRENAKQDLEIGDQVFKGEVVATLNDTIAVAALTIAQKKATNDVQIRYAKKAEEVAKQELKISEAANEKLEGTVPQVEIKKLELAAERGTLQIEQAEFEQELAKLAVDEAAAQVDSYLVKAPFTGFVRKIHRKSGEAIRQGDPILELYSEARMRITGYVTIPESYKVSSGDAVKVQLDIKDADLEIEKIWLDGKILLVDPEGAPILNRVQVVAEVLNKKSNNKYILKAGLDAKMWISPGSGAGAQVNVQTKR
jgi:multidrug efflux pump subunit AcrA (membrane-fusion protein)